MRERLGLWLVRTLRRDALPLLLVLAMGGLLAYTLDEARWVRGSHLGLGLMAALLGGAVLARSRFGGWGALGYGLMMLLAGAAEQVGRVLPGPGLLWRAPGEWVWTLHLRTLTFGQRMAGWVETLQAGQTVKDTGLFVLLASLAAWGAAVWLAWMALRQKQVLAAALPAGLLLAVNLHLSGQSWGLLVVYVVLAVGLLVHAQQARQQASWDRRGLDYPVDVGMDWATTAVGLMLVTTALASAAPLVATPSGWRLLADFVEASRREAAETAGQLFGGVAPPQTKPALRANTPDLGAIGRPIDQTAETIMWVKVSDPAPLPEYVPDSGETPPPQHYWRSGLFATYTGTGWAPLAMDAARIAGEPASGQAPAGRYPLRQQYEIVAGHGPDLFAVNVPVTTSAGAQVATLADEGTALVSGAASTYGVLSWATRATEAELRAAASDLPPELAATYLQVPAELPGRVRDLAAQIVRGAGSRYDQALRMQNYLRANYAYELDVPAPPPGRDAVDYFLFEAPGGFCSYYASAMAVMLRTQGVPARVATGYAMGVFDQARGAYRVPGAAAHAWVEVYFAGYGWVEFEPTSARAAFARAPGEVQGQATLVIPAGSTAEAEPGRPSAGQVALAAGVMGAGALAWWWLTRRPLGARGAGKTPRARALRLYGRLRGALARAGLGAAPSLTPGEFQAGAAARLGEREPLAAALAQATAVHEHAAYSAHPVGEAEVAAAERLWRRARLAWVGLWLGRGRRNHRKQ